MKFRISPEVLELVLYILSQILMGNTVERDFAGEAYTLISKEMAEQAQNN